MVIIKCLYKMQYYYNKKVTYKMMVMIKIINYLGFESRNGVKFQMHLNPIPNSKWF